MKPCGSEALSWGRDQESQKEAQGRGVSQNHVTRTEGTLDFWRMKQGEIFKKLNFAF